MSKDYIALLRGINVGGNNIIKMADLKTAFEEMGFSEVQTYIASGNVLFRSQINDQKSLVKKIENELSQRFSYESVVAVVTADELQEVIKQAPPGFGQVPTKYHYDVIFLIGITAAEIIGELELNPEVDSVWANTNVLYFRRLSAKRTKSRLPKIISKPVYKQMTIRNWNTATKLLKLIEERSE